MTRILEKITEYSLYILIFSIPLSNSAIEVCSIIAIASYFLNRIFLYKKSIPRIIKPAATPISTPLYVFAFISFLSIFWSTYPDISARAFIRKWLEYFLLFFIMAETIKDKKKARNLLIWMAMAGVIVGVDGIFQRVTGTDFIRGYEMIAPPRIRASFKYPGGLSSWLTIMIFPFLSVWIFYSRRKNIKVLSGILALALTACLMMTFSKGAILGFFAALFFMLLLKKKTRKKSIVVVAAFLVVFALFVSFSPGYIRTSFLPSAPSFDDRAFMWKTAINMIWDRPLLGQGLNTFMANYRKFNPPEGEVVGGTVSYAHNCYLQIPAEIGIFGLLAFLWMIALLIKDSVKTQALIKDGFLQAAHLGFFSGLMAFLIHSFFEVTLYSLRLAIVFWCSLGALMAISRIGKSNEA